MRCRRNRRHGLHLIGFLYLLLGGSLMLGDPAALRAQQAGTVSVKASKNVLAPGRTVEFQWQKSPPTLTKDRRQRLERMLRGVNRSRESVPEDGFLGEPPMVPATPPPGPPPESTQAIQAPGDATIFFRRPLTDAETDNSTSVINETSVATNWPLTFVTANWFAARSTDGLATLTYVDPDVALPPIPGQSFCCDQSVLFDRSRSMFIWISLWIDPSATTGTIRIAVSENLTNWTVSDFTSEFFDLSGLPDYPHVALGANYLYMTINHFDPFFTQSTIARFSLTHLKRRVSVPTDFVNRNEFNHKVAHDYGPGTKAYWASHVDNNTIRVFRWEEGSSLVLQNDIDIPAWTRGTRGDFSCVTPDGNDPCQRMDDRVLGGFVTGPKKLPAGSDAQKVVGFSWNAPQDGNFGAPHTNIVRIDAENLTLIDNPVLWHPTIALVYADMHPNDRGDVGFVLDMIGGGFHPFLAGIDLREESSVPPPWSLFGIRGGDDSPNSDGWGDYNTVRRAYPFGHLFISGGHTLQGGGNNGDVETLIGLFGRDEDLF